MITNAEFYNTYIADMPYWPFYIGFAVAAYWMNRGHLIRRPECKGYFWGYYQGLCSLPYFAVLFKAGDLSPFVTLTLLMCFCFPAAGTLKRSRWWFVMLTISSLNPILWIVNGIYISNRWEEMKPSNERYPFCNAQG